jgi:hypothetical protein
VLDIEPASTDAVLSATAYHWISRDAQTDRPATILRPGGLVAIADLIQVDSADDQGFFAAAQPIYERYSEPYAGPPAPTRDSVDPPIRNALEVGGSLLTSFLLRVVVVGPLVRQCCCRVDDDGQVQQVLGVGGPTQPISTEPGASRLEICVSSTCGP